MESVVVSAGSSANVGFLPGELRPKSGGLSPRAAKLRDIAEWFSDLVDPLNGPSGVRGDGGSLPRLQHEPGCRIHGSRPPACSCSLRSVLEFERLVDRLRVDDRELWWHLDGWFLSASSRTMWHCPRCGMTHQREHVHAKRRGSGLIRVRCKRVLVWSRVPGAQRSRAEAGLEVLAGWWGLGHEPMLPRDLRLIA